MLACINLRGVRFSNLNLKAITYLSGKPAKYIFIKIILNLTPDNYITRSNIFYKYLYICYNINTIGNSTLDKIIILVLLLILIIMMSL